MRIARVGKKLLVLGCAMLLLCGSCALAEDDLWATWTADDDAAWLDAWADVGELGDPSVELPILCGAAVLAAGGAAVAIHRRRSAR